MAYDPKATKVSKSVKRVAATITNDAQRREFIRGYVNAERANANYRAPRKQGNKPE